MDNLSDTYLSDFMRILEIPPSARKQFTNESVIIDQIQFPWSHDANYGDFSVLSREKNA